MAAPGRATGTTGEAKAADPSIVRFRALIEAGLAALEDRREEVNDLNVFPVADGDTGDNMVLTLRAVLTELDRLSGDARIGRSMRSGATRSSRRSPGPRCSGRAAIPA